MAASTVQNPVVKTESKSAKKKKAKAEAPADSQSVVTPEANQAADPVESTNGDSEYESPYIKELYKNIRNVNKKISNASKVDGIIAENSGKSLEELVSSKKINADQKAQVLKKPALQAQLAQYEEQIAQYKKFDEDYKSRALADKTQLEKTLKDGASKELREALAAAKKDSQESASAQSQQSLLLVSQFLRLAAVRRGEEQDEESEENKALEGLLAAVYTGNAQAVSAMTSLIEGSSNFVRGVDGQETSITFSKIKDLAVEAAQEQEPEQEIEPVEEEVASSTAEDTIPQSDPTIANASLTEINADQTAPLSSQAATTDVDDITQNSGFGEGVNAAAQANWDQNNDLSASQEWVEVPRDAAETETGVVATPAAPSNTQSWADDTPESPKQQKSTPPESNNNDGFHEVQRSRGPNRNQQQQQQGGPYRGRGGRGDGRGGRGFFRGRGDGRGRGRGGQDRGGRRAEADAQ